MRRNGPHGTAHPGGIEPEALARALLSETANDDVIEARLTIIALHGVAHTREEIDAAFAYVASHISSPRTHARNNRALYAHPTL